MLSVAEALGVVLGRVTPLAARRAAVGPELLGLTLAEDACADRDSPPFAKSLRDGYAIRAADGPGERRVVEEVRAGQTPTRAVGPGEATRIMTGAPMPAGADAVVMVEETEAPGDDRVRYALAPTPGRHVLDRGREMRAGEAIVRAGTRLRPEEIGLLAAVGIASASVHPRARVAVVPTGDEIVEAPAEPGPGQIRNSNGPMLLAQVARAGATPEWIGIARDDDADLDAKIGRGLACDLLVLSGGVSAGKADLVPQALARAGVDAIFRQVRMMPGKPLLFGHVPATGRWVFGLPGNPVSSLACFELFVRPAIRRLSNRCAEPQWTRGRVEAPFVYRSDRPTYHPVAATLDASGWRVRFVPWFGSPDLRGVAAGNGFARLSDGETRLAEGDAVDLLVTDRDDR